MTVTFGTPFAADSAYFDSGLSYPLEFRHWTILGGVMVITVVGVAINEKRYKPSRPRSA